jgi:hypothetical protein
VIRATNRKLYKGEKLKMNDLTEAERSRIEERMILRAIAEMNRESIERNGHLEVVSFRKDGVMHHAAYKSLTPEQIENFKAGGIIL